MENLLVILLLTILRCAIVLVEQMIQLLSFLDERTASMPGTLRWIWRNLLWRTLNYLGIVNLSQLETCAHIRRCCGLTAKNFIASVKYSFFISGDTIKIRVNENSLSLSITHVDDFGNISLMLMSPQLCKVK